MPRNEKEMSICAPSEDECVEEAIIEVETSILDTKAGSIGAKCACLPACTEIKFSFTMSQSQASAVGPLKLPQSIKEGMTDTFVRDNVAIVHIFHEELHFLKHERGEVYYFFF